MSLHKLHSFYIGEMDASIITDINWVQFFKLLYNIRLIIYYKYLLIYSDRLYINFFFNLHYSREQIFS